MPALNTTFSTDQLYRWYQSELKMHEANLRAAKTLGNAYLEKYHQKKVEEFVERLNRLDPLRPPSLRD